ncbi:hypothetical protein L218DRAFT_907029, partial [Marasmius fiardii PR-910]
MAPQGSQTYNAHNITIGHAEINNIGGNQFNVSPSKDAPRTLWDAVAGVGASHDSGLQFDRGHCLPGTREEVRRMIHEWRKSNFAPPVCWLSGTAGVGKSAIALTVAEESEKNGLVASFFFFRSDPRRNNSRFLIL